MEHLSREMLCNSPECQAARNCLDLLVYLGRDERVNSLKDLLMLTREVELEYSRLVWLRA